MKIRTRLRVNSYISLGVLFIALLSLLWSYLEVLQADKKTGLVEKMRNVHFERTILRDEYLLHQEVRARIQWIAKSGDFEKLIDLADTLLTSREEKAMMEEAREEFVQTVLVFSKIIGSREKNERRGGAELLSAEAEKRLLSHVFQNASALTDTIKRIREAEQKNAIRARDRENAFIVLFFIGVVVIIVANSNAVYRIFTKRITALSDGARILGSGNLDHRIEAEGDDELSALARSNNEMAVRLKESYTSIDNLQKEMAERALAEKALRESEDRFRLLIEGVSDYAIFMLDPDGNVVSWNSGAERIKGYREDEIIGKNFNRFYTQEDSAHGKPQQDLQDAITAGRFEDEGWRLRKDGSRFWANVIITALRDRGGQLRGFSKVTRDITERKQAEEKIKKLNEELEQRVHDRTAQLEVANNELEAFSYSVSHDLRAPLRHMTGFVELLNKCTLTLDEKSRHYLEVISNAAQHMGRLVDDLLSFSRMGRTEMMRTRVKLGTVVDDAVHDLKADSKGRNIDWDIRELPDVEGDPAMLKLVFANLLSNSLKFTRSRPRAAIEVGCESSETDGETVVYVKDNGVGFDMKYVEKLFNLFQRLHRPEDFEGTGVGLANVRRIIHRHGGRTWAEGVVNEGATIRFSLPKTVGEDI